jgi:hypothetical protein
MGPPIVLGSNSGFRPTPVCVAQKSLMEREVIHIRTGISVPSSVQYHFRENEAPPLHIIIGHGLGAKHPKLKSHENDDWIQILQKPIEKLEGIIQISYTARGHGDSFGWQESAESNIEQFSWSSLSHDMIAVADYYQIESFIASGSSMGSATSLFTAIYFPSRVKAVIMIRPPTAWKERVERRKHLIASANRCQKNSSENEKYHFVLRGAALADFPPLEDIETYRRISCPVLILTVKGDDAHPIRTAEALSQLISTSELHIAETNDEANEVWPSIIYQFLEKVRRNGSIIEL